MEKFNALILGTDSNSYSVARSFYEAFSKKAIVAGSAVLVPFVDSKIADINTKKNFSTDDDVFVKLLNKIGKKHKDEKLVFFCTNWRIYVNAFKKSWQIRIWLRNSIP